MPLRCRSRFTHYVHVSQLWHMIGEATGLGAPGIVLYAVALGALAFLDTWDFPIYVGLVMLALGVGLALADRLSWGAVGRAVAGASCWRCSAGCSICRSISASNRSLAVSYRTCSFRPGSVSSW